MRVGRCAALLAGLGMGAMPALAQEPAPPVGTDTPITQAAPVAATASDNAMVNLVRMLVEQGVLTADKGQALIAQAQGEAATVRSVAASDLPPAAAGSIRVPYVPETVRAQIRNELRQEVLQQARAENWAAPGEAAPEWTRRIRITGDVRVRSQSELLARTNSDQIPNFGLLSQVGPTDLINGQIPLINSRDDRYNTLLLRARLGIQADIAPGVRAGVRLATGDDRSPVSTNASLGGGFGKRDVWLDLAYLRVQPTDWSNVLLGRFDSPFRTTNLLFDPEQQGRSTGEISIDNPSRNINLLFDQDVALDGVAVEVATRDFLGSGLRAALRGGAFPLDFGDPNFPVQSFRQESELQRYLFAVQGEIGAAIGDLRLDATAGYFSFENIQGELSEPCPIFLGAVECSTDNRRAFFVSRGNTLSPLRQVAADPTLAPGQIQPQPQLLGLTFGYRLLYATASVSTSVSEGITASLAGEYVNNLAYRRSDTCRFGLLGQPYNNGGDDGNGNICDSTNPTSFIGGNQGYQITAALGRAQPRRPGEWRVIGGYRYLESDAVLDSLTDSDFNLGGTNSKGYFIGGDLGIYNGVAVGARYLSANEVAGEPFASDVVQVELRAVF